MKLIKSDASPFVRKTLVTLHETGLLEQTELVSVTTSPLNSDPTVLATNPIGKIPALVRDDGPALYDSRVICRYLDAKAGAGLYPESRLWETLTLEATGDGIMDSAVSMTYEARFRGPELVFEDWVEAQWAKVSRALDALEERWMSHLAGPLDMGQISVACALGYLDLRHDARGWRNGRPALAAWHEAFEQRASMKATAPV
ncbi:glutathione S-transferase [Pacificoceanicola onchidii]|uniref:glutathione S-transferase n=1 Tax=Pacificoceanicola onchidii TaxID=2562685 RepID=UPI0010A4BF93|nr:glutathione S-transferase [Pacificoceanicola onchidii]